MKRKNILGEVVEETCRKGTEEEEHEPEERNSGSCFIFFLLSTFPGSRDRWAAECFFLFGCHQIPLPGGCEPKDGECQVLVH